METPKADFRRRLEETMKEYSYSGIESAFVTWFVDNAYAAPKDKKIITGVHSNDGGIDAVVFEGDYTYVIQGAYTEAFFKSKKAPALSPSKYTSLNEVRRNFTSDHAFNSYLDTVARPLHIPYRKIRKNMSKDPNSVIWLITTLNSRSPAGEKRLRDIDPTNFKYGVDNLMLFQLAEIDATPMPLPMKLTFKENPITIDDRVKGLKSYVLQARVVDFISYIEDEQGLRCLARNVRTELPDKAAKQISEGIKNTYEQNPADFWYSHNGITMICTKAVSTGKQMRIENPFIINGAQTLLALRNSTKRNDSAFVLTRIIEVPPEVGLADNFVNDIICRTNQQNRMYLYDLRANDRFQIKLARYFLDKKVHYERKRGEWALIKQPMRGRGYKNLTIKRLAQIRVCCLDKEGGVEASKKTIEDLFRDERYNELFGAPFEEIYFQYRIYELLQTTLKNPIKGSRTVSRERSHAMLSCLMLLWACVENDQNIHKWYDAVLNKPSRLDWDPKNPLVKTIEDMFNAVWNRWIQLASKDPNLSANNFFKSKEHNRELLKEFQRKYQKRVRQGFQKALK
ncbi:MAG: AIPR family protein [Actinobacteria bacterium]|nr:AIPR family protein [Actinomycetota bacterium]